MRLFKPALGLENTELITLKFTINIQTVGHGLTSCSERCRRGERRDRLRWNCGSHRSSQVPSTTGGVYLVVGMPGRRCCGVRRGIGA